MAAVTFNAFGSHGSVSHICFRHFHSFIDARTYLKEGKDCDICGVVIADGADEINEHSFKRNTSFVLGNETKYCYTGVWTEKWVMDRHPRRPMNRHAQIDLELKVSALITTDGKWRHDRLVDLFPPADVVRILEIPIGMIKDGYMWAYTEHGAYSVKSGQWLISNHPMIPHAPLSAVEQTRINLKQRIWRLKTEPKIRFFLWRALSGALAVADKLNSRGINMDPICKLCQQSTESINHVLFRCTAAQQILETSQLQGPSNGFAETIEENMTFVLDSMEATTSGNDIIARFPWIIWSIWKNRNEILFATKLETAAVISRRALEDAQAWMDANKPQLGLESAQLKVRVLDARWRPPTTGIIKCNLNVNWRNSRFHCGGAWITRDHRTEVIHHAREAFTNSSNRTVAKLRGVIWVLQSLRDLRMRNIQIALDCRAALDAILKPETWPRYRALTENILSLRQGFDSCFFDLESQKSNHIAREIAKSVLRDERFQSYLARGGPSWLHELIQRDAQGNC